MSHLAAALGLFLFDIIERNEIEILCMSSGPFGAVLAEGFSALLARRKAALRAARAGTNAQDRVVLRLRLRNRTLR